MIFMQIPINITTDNCINKIRTTFSPDSPPGGTWTYVGYNATTDDSTWNNTASNGIMGSIVPGTVLSGWGDNFTLNTKDKSPGYYKFTYSIGPVEVIIQLIDKTDCIGNDGGSTSFSISDNELYPLLSYMIDGNCPIPADYGTWTDNSGYGAGFNPATGELNPASAPGPGLYTFSYTLIEPGYTVTGCSSCTSADITAIFSVTINP